MVTENTIKNNVKKKLKEEGYHTWAPARGGYMNQLQDVFGVFDILAIKGFHIRYIQYTSKKNMTARKKKIAEFFKKHNCFIPCEIWGYDEEKREFKIALLTFNQFTY